MIISNKNKKNNSLKTYSKFALLILAMNWCICPPEGGNDKPDKPNNSLPGSTTDVNFFANLKNNQAYINFYKGFNKIYEVYKMVPPNTTLEYEIFEKKLQSKYFKKSKNR
jgi:hypothetical protein